jgi:mono/diheme cytochrome c family protein
LVLTVVVIILLGLGGLAAVALPGDSTGETDAGPRSTLLPAPTSPTVPPPDRPTSSTTPTTAAMRPTTTAAPAPTGAGAEIYAGACASCHGADRRGGVGPELTAATVRTEYPEVADQVEAVLGGVGDMDGFEDVLTAEQVLAVVLYTRQG